MRYRIIINNKTLLRPELDIKSVAYWQKRINKLPKRFNIKATVKVVKD